MHLQVFPGSLTWAQIITTCVAMICTYAQEKCYDFTMKENGYICYATENPFFSLFKIVIITSSFDIFLRNVLKFPKNQGSF